MKNNYVRRILTVMLAGSLCTAGLVGCGKEKVQAEISPSDVLATINGEEVPAGVLAILAHYEQMQTEALYQMYFGSSAANMWDMQVEEDGEETYGQQAVTSALEELEKMYLLRAHAEEYGVSLTEEQKTTIAQAAESFVQANGEEILEKLQTNQECVEEYMELAAYQQLMQAPVSAGADPEVSDEEAQQTTVTYATITKPEEVSAEEETEEAEETDETTEDETVEDDTKTLEELQALAQDILDVMNEDPEQDMLTVAQEIYEAASVDTVSFSTNEEDDSIPEEIKTAVADLKDGEMVPEVIEGENALYVVRLDAAFDEEATENKRESIVSDRQSEFYTETVDGWLSDAEITVKEEIKSGIEINSTEIFVEKTVEEEDTEAVEDTETVEEDTETVEAEEIEEPEELEEVEETAEPEELEKAEETEEAEGKTDKEKGE